jgi:hypothetical protein
VTAELESYPLELGPPQVVPESKHEMAGSSEEASQAAKRWLIATRYWMKAEYKEIGS